jgi:hypothetical protein
VTPSEILGVLDQGATAGVFPMMDNGYIYLAATRMSLLAAPPRWGLVFEVFGFSPRAGIPQTSIVTFSNALQSRASRDQYVSEEAYRAYLRSHPHDESRTVWPCDEGDWIDEEDCEFVSPSATHVVLRSQRLALPSEADYTRIGVEHEESGRVTVYELCRALADMQREMVLATRHERRANLPPDLPELLVLEEWNHPDLAASELPSQSATFNQVAAVLGTGDISRYAPTARPNTHWSHWPEGGTL